MLQPQKKTFGEKVYPWILVLLPVLNQYQFGPVDLDVIVMAIFFLCAMFFHRHIRISPVGRFVLVLIGYMIFVTVANIAIGYKFSHIADIIIRSGKFILYLLIVFFLGNECVSYESLMKAYRVIAFAATVYVIIQTIFFYGAGITLPSKIGGNIKTNDVDVGRLRAFYSEPAVMSYSLMPFIICSLFGKPYHNKNAIRLFDAGFVSVAIVLSTSGQGIVVMAAIWLLWIILQVIKGTFKARQFLLLLCVVVAAIILYRSGILKFAIDRADNVQEGGAIDSRLSGYKSLELLTTLKLLFGAGFGNYVVENTFGLDLFREIINYSSIAQFLFTLGIVGTTLWFLFFTKLFFRSNTCARIIILALLMLSVFGAPLVAIQLPVWLSMICLQMPEGQFARKSTLADNES